MCISAFPRVGVVDVCLAIMWVLEWQALYPPSHRPWAPLSSAALSFTQQSLSPPSHSKPAWLGSQELLDEMEVN